MHHSSKKTLTLLALLSLYTIISLSFANLPQARAQTDLIVSGNNTFHITDSVYPVPGNVIVKQNGTLILDHGTLNETSPGSPYNITIRDNGQLILQAGSTILAQNPMTLYVKGNGTLTVKDNSVVRIGNIDVQTTNNIQIQSSALYVSSFLSSSASAAISDSIIKASATTSSSLSVRSTKPLKVSNSSLSARAKNSVLALNSSTVCVNNSFLGAGSEALSSAGLASMKLFATNALTANDSVLSIHNATTFPVSLVLSVSAPQIAMQDSQLELPLKLNGTSIANLVNVTMPSSPKTTNSAKITTYWWLTATAQDNSNLPLPGAAVNAYYNYPINTSLARTGLTNRFGQVKLKLLDTVYTSAPPNIMENYAVNATFQTASSGAAKALPQPMSSNRLYNIKLPILNPSYLFLQAPSTPIEFGKTVTFTGSVHPSNATGVLVGIRPQGTKIFTFQNAIIASDGSFTLPWKATSLGNFEAQASWNGSFPNYHGNQSSLLAITVTKITVTLTVILSSNNVELVPFFGSVTISGVMVPVRSNINLTVQYSLDGVTWKLIGHVLTDSTGAYSIHWNAPGVGTYLIRVLGPEAAIYKASVSTTQTLVVNYITIQNAVYLIVGLIVIGAVLKYTRREKRSFKPRPQPRRFRPCIYLGIESHLAHNPQPLSTHE